MLSLDYLTPSPEPLPDDICWESASSTRVNDTASPLTDLLLNRFPVAAVAKPENFCGDIKKSGEVGKLMNFAKGTTILGFKCSAGVFVATDSRASMGSYIASSTVEKTLVITKKILGTMSGGAADCTYWQRYLSKQCRLYELRNGESISVAAASNMLANILYNFKGYGLSAGIVLGGYDHKGAHLYFIDDSGTRLKGNCFSSGSGSIYAYGILDSFLKETMTAEEAVEVACSALYHATHRDAGSGGTASVHQITEDGSKTLVSKQDVAELHKHYCKIKGRPLDQL